MQSFSSERRETREWDRKPLLAWVHTSDYSAEELILSQSLADDLALKVGDFVRVRPSSTAEARTDALADLQNTPSHVARDKGPIVLRVGFLDSSKANLQVSMLKQVAELYGFASRFTIDLESVSMSEASLDWVEMVFKDQYISRGDLWYWNHTMTLMQPNVFKGKTFLHSGARSHVAGMMRGGQAVASGCLSHETKVIFRSRSANCFLLIQMSPEMWEAAPDGEMPFEKALKFLATLFSRWEELGVTHNVTIVLFGRCFTEKQSQEDVTQKHSVRVAQEGRRDPGLMKDRAGRAHTDYYRLVVESESRKEWHSLLPTLRSHFHGWNASLKRRERAFNSQLDGSTETISKRSPAEGAAAALDEKPSEKKHRRVPTLVRPGKLATAREGNLLEAINLALDIQESSHEELDLASTGKSVVVLTAGSGCFEVDYALSALTKQRMVDYGIGCDMVCAGSPPLHLVPLFSYISQPTPSHGTRADHGQNENTKHSSTDHGAPNTGLPDTLLKGEKNVRDKWYRIPQWILISYTDPPPPYPLPEARVHYAPPYESDSPILALATPPLPPIATARVSVLNADDSTKQISEGKGADDSSSNVSSRSHTPFPISSRSSFTDNILSLANAYDFALFNRDGNHLGCNDQTEFTEMQDDNLTRDFSRAAKVAGSGFTPPSPLSPTLKSSVDPWHRHIPNIGSGGDFCSTSHSLGNGGSLTGSFSDGHAERFPALPGWLRGTTNLGAGHPKYSIHSESPRGDFFRVGSTDIVSQTSSSHSSRGESLKNSTDSLGDRFFLSEGGRFVDPSRHAQNPKSLHHHNPHSLPYRGSSLAMAMPEDDTLDDAEADIIDGKLERSTQGAFENAQLITRLESVGVGAAKSAAQMTALTKVRKSTNPFLFLLPSELSQLQRHTDASYAFRRWRSVRSQSSRDGPPFTMDGFPSKEYFHLKQNEGWIGSDETPSNGGKIVSEGAGTASYHQYQPHFEHQWTSLTEPAVLPLTAEGTTEQLRMMQRNPAAESWWQLTVPRQNEVPRELPYKSVMSAEELLYELVCQRLEQDFQLLRPPEKKRSPVSLNEEQTFYLALGAQVQAVKFIKDEKLPPHIPTRDSTLMLSVAGSDFGKSTPPVSGAASSGVWSRIQITRHFVQSQHDQRGATRQRLGYHYMFSGPLSHGFERSYTLIRPATPHNYPWNSVDHCVCGWNTHLGPSMRLRCKRFALLNFENRQGDLLSSILSAPLGTQRLLRAAIMIERSEIADPQEDSAVNPSDETRVTLSKERFERFLDSIRPRLPGEMNVQWRQHHSTLLEGSPDATADARVNEVEPPSILDEIAFKDVTELPDDNGKYGRRMFFKLVYDSEACERQAWHLELQWLMCEGPRIEDFVQHCTRRARLAGLLMLQIPTGRRPRPFTPHAIVPIATNLQSQAAAALCNRLSFVCECARVGKQRWMHELGVAFVKQHSAGFIWEVNRLLPSQAARDHSAKLLAKFWDICDKLECGSQP